MPKRNKKNSRVKWKKASERQRAKPIPLQSETDDEPTIQMFENICVYIHPNNISNSRLNVLRSLIVKNGGSFTDEPNNETTHVLVDESISSGKLCRALDWATYPPHVNVLLVGWLSASIRANRCLELDDYEIPCTHRPTFVAEQRHVEAVEENNDVRNELNEENDCDEPSSDITIDSESEDGTASFDSVVADITTYDDGKYEDDTSCDDDWVRISPIAPVNPCCEQASLPPYSSFKSSQPKTSDLSGNDKPNNVPERRPDTLAARLSRLRIRRIPEAGKGKIIIDLSNENCAEQTSRDHAVAESQKQIVGNDTNFITYVMPKNDTDHKSRLSKPKNIPSKKVSVGTEKETGPEEKRCGEKRSWSFLSKDSIPSTNLFQPATFSESSLMAHYANKTLDTDLIIQVYENKNDKDSVNVFPPEEFNMHSDNVVNQVLKMMVESVFEVAVSELVINQSFEDMLENEFSEKILQEENAIEEVVSGVLFGIVNDVSKGLEDTCKESLFQIVEVETMNKNVLNVSKFAEIEKIETNIVDVENEIDISEPKATNEIGIKVANVETREDVANFSQHENSGIKTVNVKDTNENINILQPEATNKDETVDKNISILHPEATNENGIKIADIESADGNKMGISLSEITNESVDESETKISDVQAAVVNKMEISNIEETDRSKFKIASIETIDKNKMDISLPNIANESETTTDEKKMDGSLHSITNGNEIKIAKVETIVENKLDISLTEETNRCQFRIAGVDTVEEYKVNASLPEATNGNKIKIIETVYENDVDITRIEETGEYDIRFSSFEAVTTNIISEQEAANEYEIIVANNGTGDEMKVDIFLPETTEGDEFNISFVESESENDTSISYNEGGMKRSLEKGMSREEKNSPKRMKFDTSNAEISVFQSSQASTVPIASPYPMHVYCSVEGESPIPPCLPNNEMNFKLEESMSNSENPHDENLNNLARSEVTNNEIGSPSIKNQTNELDITVEPRSCSRPDIRGPNIFFPFPKPSATPTSDNPGSSNEPSASQRFLYFHSPNADVIKKLQLLYEGFKKCKDTWRVHAYDRAISLLGRYPKVIASLKEVERIGNMSKNIAKKIWHIKETGNLKEIEDICNKRWSEARKLFTKAWGISPRIAFKLYKQGNGTIQDIYSKSLLLSQNQRVGLRYYRDLRTKMTKKEAIKILSTVMRVIFGISSSVQCDACSSLRRNKNVVSNVSILVTLPSGCRNTHRLLPDIVAKLHRLGYIADDLIRHQQNGDQTKYVGIFKLGRSSKYRRLDITVCTQNEHACAKLFLTGTSYFNRAIRQWAARKEMLLDEHCLRIRLLNIGGGTSAVTKLYTPDEPSIFRFLQLPYRTPEQRDRIVI
ncbi:DNA polymerase lambda [Nephila pilipes]|uniref:DNA polymerase lambda n=1 Tax=Nephila pilipes TaxID=299642 RepID=A0A8X6NB57_NEPPI|nr:DNA polymerase lambda [Nephila pilipes]